MKLTQVYMYIAGNRVDYAASFTHGEEHCESIHICKTFCAGGE